MGQCCKIFQQAQKPTQESRKTELLTKTQLNLTYNTRNDKEFTYFFGVYDLIALGQRLELPEYIDQLNPNFSYQKFNETYHGYQREIKNLGKYVENYRNEDSLLSKRIAIDRLNIQTHRKLNKIPKGNDRGCLIKLQIQSVKWNGAKQIIVKLLNPSNWQGKFQKHYKIEQIELGPIFIEFSVPNQNQSFLQITSTEAGGEIKINIEQSIKNDQQLVCKVLKWKQARQTEGLAVRLQIVSEDSREQKEKINQMSELYQKLIKDYGVDGEMEQSFNEKYVNERLSRHRSSLSIKYRLTNSKF